MSVTISILEDTYTGGQEVTGFTLTNAGTGYSSVPTVTVAAPTVGGVAATATAVLDGTGLLPLDSITLDTLGSGYIAAPAVTIAAPGSGVTATATASITTGDPNTYTGSTVLMINLDDEASPFTIDASTMLGGSNGTEGFQKYTIMEVDWSLNTVIGPDLDLEMTWTGTGLIDAMFLTNGNGKYRSTPITNNATQPGDATNADIVCTPGGAINGFILMKLKKEAFV